MRLFAALALPDGVVERLTSFRLRMSGPKDGLRWSEPEQWHVTLQFYGEVEESRVRCLEEMSLRLNASAPEMLIDGVGLFGAKGILFAKVEPTASLLHLQGEMQKRSAECGIVSESRPFRPHITLARSKGKPGQKSLQRMTAPALPSIGAPLRWRAGEVLLLESVLRPQGAEYRIQGRLALSGDGEAGGASGALG